MTAPSDVAAGDVAPLPISSALGTRNLPAAERAAADLLIALGVDLDDESRSKTPGRMARAFDELLTPRRFDLTTFPNDEGYQQLVIEREIGFTSLCEHHFLPFTGHAYVAYLPGERILGLSKLARVVELFAHKPQVQERLTQQVADWLNQHLHPKGVGVVLVAEHLCMTLRGARATGSSTVTSALHGLLLNDARAREEFFSLANIHA
ncbi:GTP cyclohydrolase I [Actinomadura barringtoniae]|uniref:GTP cyclohydrolase 1 n=1 Tax=Actinomadura barringtoniae TaxID=1427535 RepID=A0A939T1A1_9ACTN|nr:GTP cyclohydrolase I [Actinomadura barringtoniae]MBO2447111.1 GTP cyclohydrolase I [Actinomadura barringtoniae]